MDIDLLIRIHELSRGAKENSLDKFSTLEIKNELSSLVEGLKYVETLSKSKMGKDYTGFVSSDSVISYYHNGSEIFSRLDESCGIECGLLSFKSGNINDGRYNLNFEYRGGMDPNFSFIGEDKSPLVRTLNSLSRGVSVFNPTRNVQSFYGDIDSWTFFQNKEFEGSFHLTDFSKQIDLNLNYNKPHGSEKISQFKEIQSNLQNLKSFNDIKKFFVKEISDKVAERYTLDSRYFKPASFKKIFKGKVK